MDERETQTEETRPMQDMTKDQMGAIANADIMGPDGTKQIEAILDALDLPALTGSPKQIEWATHVRAHAIHVAVREMGISGPKGQKAAYANTAAKMVAEHSTSAAWWIDHRDKADVILHYLKSLAAK